MMDFSATPNRTVSDVIVFQQCQRCFQLLPMLMPTTDWLSWHIYVSRHRQQFVRNCHCSRLGENRILKKKQKLLYIIHHSRLGWRRTHVESWRQQCAVRWLSAMVVVQITTIALELDCWNAKQCSNGAINMRRCYECLCIATLWFCH